MKCFACFSAYNHKKPKPLMGLSETETLIEKRGHGDSGALKLCEYVKQEPVLEEMVNESIIEPKVKLIEEQLSCCNEREKVAFGSPVQTFEAISNENNGNVKSDILKASSTEMKLNSGSIAANLAHYPTNYRYQNCTTGKVDDLGLEDCELDDGTKHFDYHSKSVFVCEESSDSLFSISIDSRKQSYGVELGDNDKEVSSPMPKFAPHNEVTSKKGAELGDNDKEVSSPMPKFAPHNEVTSKKGAELGDKNVNDCDSRKEVAKKIEGMDPGADLVLSPLENVSQRKADRKADRGRSSLPFQHEDKENVGVERDHNICHSPEPSLKVLNVSTKGNGNWKRLLDQEVTVDTSLSSWLVLSEVTPKSGAKSVETSQSAATHLPRNHEVKTASGASETGRKSKQPAVSSTPRLRRRKTSKTPVMGTVGSYWRRTGQSVDSDSDGSNTISIDLKVEGLKWEFCSPPFHARRLEGTL